MYIYIYIYVCVRMCVLGIYVYLFMYIYTHISQMHCNTPPTHHSLQDRPLISLEHTAPHCNTLQHTATHCKKTTKTHLRWPILNKIICSLQHTATTSTLQHIATTTQTRTSNTSLSTRSSADYIMTATLCNRSTLQTHCNALQHTATAAQKNTYNSQTPQDFPPIPS